jgi:hypothetical protein
VIGRSPRTEVLLASRRQGHCVRFADCPPGDFFTVAPALRPACANASEGRPRAFGQRAVASAEGGPQAGDGWKSAAFPAANHEDL